MDDDEDEEGEAAEKKFQEKVKRGVSLRSFIQMSIVSTTRDPEGERKQLKALGYDLPAEAFPEAEKDEDMLEVSGGDEESQIQQLMTIISGGTATTPQKNAPPHQPHPTQST